MESGYEASDVHHEAPQFTPSNRNRAFSTSSMRSPTLQVCSNTSSLPPSCINESGDLSLAVGNTDALCLPRLSCQLRDHLKQDTDMFINNAQSNVVYGSLSGEELLSRADSKPTIPITSHEEQTQNIFLGIQNNYKPVYIHYCDELLVSTPIGVFTNDIYLYLMGKKDVSSYSLIRQQLWIHTCHLYVQSPLNNISEMSSASALYPFQMSSDAPQPNDLVKKQLTKPTLANIQLFHELDIPMKMNDLVSYLEGDTKSLDMIIETSTDLTSTRPLNTTEIEDLLNYLQLLPCPASFADVSFLKQTYSMSQILQSPTFHLLSEAIDVHASIQLFSLCSKMLPYISHSVLGYWREIPNEIQNELLALSSMFYHDLDILMHNSNGRMELTEYTNQLKETYISYIAKYGLKNNINNSEEIMIGSTHPPDHSNHTNTDTFSIGLPSVKSHTSIYNGKNPSMNSNHNNGGSSTSPRDSTTLGYIRDSTTLGYPSEHQSSNASQQSNLQHPHNPHHSHHHSLYPEQNMRHVSFNATSTLNTTPMFGISQTILQQPKGSIWKYSDGNTTTNTRHTRNDSCFTLSQSMNSLNISRDSIISQDLFSDQQNARFKKMQSTISSNTEEDEDGLTTSTSQNRRKTHKKTKSDTNVITLCTKNSEHNKQRSNKSLNVNPISPLLAFPFGSNSPYAGDMMPDSFRKSSGSNIPIPSLLRGLSRILSANVDYYNGHHISSNTHTMERSHENIILPKHSHFLSSILSNTLKRMNSTNSQPRFSDEHLRTSQEFTKSLPRSFKHSRKSLEPSGNSFSSL